MAITALGRIFRVAALNKAAATTIPTKNAIKSTADCCVMQFLYSPHAPRADIRPSKEMAAARRRGRQPGLEHCRNALGPPEPWPPDTRVPIPQLTSRVLQRMQPRS